MYHVRRGLTPNGAKIIDIAGEMDGMMMDGLVTLDPTDTFHGRPFAWWEPGRSYDADFTPLSRTPPTVQQPGA